MSKYKPLSDHLGGRSDAEWRASFAELEEVLGFPLPKSAREHRAWWGNEVDPKRGHAKAWLGAGWRVDQVDQGAGSVVFRRHAEVAAAQPAAVAEPLPQPASRETQVKRAAGVAAIAGAAVAVLAGVGAVLARTLRRR